MKYKSAKSNDKYKDFSFGEHVGAKTAQAKRPTTQPAFKTYRSPEYSAYVYDKNGVYTGTPVIKKRPKAVSTGNRILRISLIVMGAMLLIWSSIYLIFRPRITVNGEKNIVLNAGTEYVDPGATARFFGSNVTNKLKVIGDDAVNTAIIGVYEIDYIYEIPSLGMTFVERRYVRITDEQPPVLTLLGSDEMKVRVGGSFLEPGYTAFDNLDGDLSEQVEVAGFINADRAGTYEMVYTVADSNGNSSTALRTVTVLDFSPAESDIATFSLDGFFPSAVLKTTDDAGADYVAETMFFGDTYVYNLAEFGFINIAQTWWYNDVSAMNALDDPLEVGGTATSKTIAELLEENKPKRLVMILGSEAVGDTDPQAYVKAYTELLIAASTKSPDTEIIVSGLTPVVIDYDERSYSTITNQKINAYNFYIAEMCAQLDIPFLDAGSALKDSTGAANENYVETYRESGMYFTSAGSEAYLNYLRTHSVYGQ